MSEETVKPVPRWVAGVFLAYFAVLLPACAFGLWRLIDASAARAAAAGGAATTGLKLTEGELILAVILAGALGSYVHAVNSFVTYVGNRRFVASWMPWYLLRPFMGVAIAVVFYVAIRSGLLALSNGAAEVDAFAVMTVAALSGMFSKQASDKLAELFDTMFRSQGDEERADKLQTVTPKLAALDPPKVAVGSEDTQVKATGEGFTAESVVELAGKPCQRVSQTATEIVFVAPKAELANVRDVPVVVVNPAPSGKSNELVLTVAVQVPALVGGGAGAGAGVGGDAGGESGDGSVG